MHFSAVSDDIDFERCQKKTRTWVLLVAILLFCLAFDVGLIYACNHTLQILPFSSMLLCSFCFVLFIVAVFVRVLVRNLRDLYWVNLVPEHVMVETIPVSSQDIRTLSSDEVLSSGGLY